MTIARLGDVALIEVGLPFRSAEFSRDPAAIRLLRGDNVSQGRLDWSGAARWSATAAVDPKYAMAAGDIVLAMDRPWVGAGLKRSRVRADDVPAYLVQRVARLRAKPGLDQGYLGYVVDSAGFSDYLLSVQTGTAIPHISGSQISGYRFKLPPLPEQQAIAEVLGALDDKIAANTALAATAEKTIALAYEVAISGDTTPAPLLDELSIEFGEPFGGGFFSDPGEGRPLIRIRDLKTFESQVWTTEARRNEAVVSAGDVLVGMDAEFRATTWLGEPGVLNQRVLRASHSTYGRALVREMLKRPLAEVEGEKSATTVIHLNKADLARKSVVLPASDSARHFESHAEPLYEMRVALAAENRTLAATRDLLLPQLMSGKLRVRDAETIVSSAGTQFH